MATPQRPRPGSIDLARYTAATDLAARAAGELALLAGSVENLAAQLATITADRDRLAADLAEARTLLEALRQVDRDAPPEGPGPLPSDA